MENLPAAPQPARQWFRLASIARRQPIGQDLPEQAPAPPVPAPAPAVLPPRPSQAPIRRIPPRPPAGSAQSQPQSSRPSTPSSQQALPPTTNNGAPLQQPQPRSPLLRRQVTPPTASVEGSLQPPISQPQPSPVSRILSRSPTPPESPKVIEQASPTTPESPKIPQLQPIKAPRPYPEPELKPLNSPNPKSVSLQPKNNNGGVKTVEETIPKTRINGNHSKTDAKAPPPSPIMEARNGEPRATARKDDDGGMKIITVAGENLGAYMDLVTTQGTTSIENSRMDTRCIIEPSRVKMDIPWRRKAKRRSQRPRESQLQLL